MSDIITVDKLSKRYGSFTAVDGISFTVREGETFGILGPNGAGKTTTLEMIEGLRQISGGTAVLDGKDVGRDPRGVKSVIGIQLQKSDFFEYLRLPELLDVFASLYGQTTDAMDLLRQVQLTEKAKSTVRQLSGGQKQRFSIAAALVNDPKVLFLDEPTTGLDPQARRNLWDLVEEIKSRGKTIVLTTHYMEEAEVLCDRIAVMDHAKIIALDTVEGLIRNSGVTSAVSFRMAEDCPIEHFQKIAGVTNATHEHGIFKLLTDDPEQTLSALFTHERDCGHKVSELSLQHATLEDVFLKFTGRQLRD